MSKLLKKYPPPKTNPVYVRYWNIFIEEIAGRDNFQLTHLFMLENLCDMYVEKQRLEEIIDLIGYTYEGGEGRNGNQIKPRPETSLLARVRIEIRNYHKSLGLAVKESRTEMVESEAESESWE
jgi:hypothetical protein